MAAQITITLPDGSSRECPRGTTGEEIAASVIELSDSIHIASIDCALQLAEVYDRVEFPEEEEEPDDE